MTRAAPPAFEMLPLGDVRPAGWLQDQLLVQARGITGRLEDLWPNVGPTSGWLGGPGECWERGPYYLDGLVALAEVLDDDGLRATAAKWIEWTLASQRDDGFFGPPHNLDWWPRMVMLNVLLSHHSATGDERVPPFVERYLRYAHDVMPDQPLEMWAAARGAEMIPAVLWCHDRTGEDWLLELADLLVAQSSDWAALYGDFPFRGPAADLPLGRVLRAYLPPRVLIEELIRRWRPAQRTRARTAEQIRKSNASEPLRFYHRTHGVNHAMALRGVAYVASVTGGDIDSSARLADDTVMCFHGSVVGVVTADEHLAGRSPVHGIETCAVVETMRSCEELVRLTGDGWWGDRLEQVAFNALPAALTQDTMGHQYYQQVNQVEVSRRWRPWFNASRDASLFGLEPTYGCCTANLHQGWPKLAATAVMRSVLDDGVVVATLVPCSAVATVAGTEVRLTVDTNYPFDGDVRIGLELHGQDSVAFPLRLRVPGWAAGVEFDVNGDAVDPAVERGFAVLDRSWHSGDVVGMRLPMPVRTESAPVGTEKPGESERGVVVRRGPLVMSLALPEAWTTTQPLEPVPDWEVRTPSPWAYGLPDSALGSARLFTNDSTSDPFDPSHPRVELQVSMRTFPGWALRRGSAGPVPEAMAPHSGVAEQVSVVTLRPYGASALRVTVFPALPALPRAMGS